MSRLGKKPIEIPKGVEVRLEGDKIIVKGPKGEISRCFDNRLLSVQKEQDFVKIVPKKENIRARTLWGTYASHIKNMIEGVNAGFTKVLIVEGIGFKAIIDGGVLVLNLGFSHQIRKPVPKGIEMAVEKNKIRIFGFDKELVGQTAAEIRALKKPEPYKGKGIRYEGEIIRRKSGKKTVGSS